MTLIPWRVKNFLSEHFPLLYHLARNAGTSANTPEHWDQRLAETWDDPSRSWPAKNDLLASLLPPSATILDVGCGNGGVLRNLSSRGFRDLHGLEISQYAIERLTNEGIKMHFGMLPSIPLPDGTFDAVIASQVLEHIIRRGRFVGEIRRVLKRGGDAFFFVPDNCLGPISEAEHVAKYTAGSLRAFLDKHLTVIRVESIRDPNHEMPILFAHARKPGDG